MYSVFSRVCECKQACVVSFVIVCTKANGANGTRKSEKNIVVTMYCILRVAHNTMRPRDAKSQFKQKSATE